MFQTHLNCEKEISYSSHISHHMHGCKTLLQAHPTTHANFLRADTLTHTLHLGYTGKSAQIANTPFEAQALGTAGCRHLPLQRKVVGRGAQSNSRLS